MLRWQSYLNQLNTNLAERHLLLVRPIRDRVLGGDNGLRLCVRLDRARETIHRRRLFGGRVRRVVIHVASEQHELLLGLCDLGGVRLEGARKHRLDADRNLSAGIQAFREVHTVEFCISESLKNIHIFYSKNKGLDTHKVICNTFTFLPPISS